MRYNSILLVLNIQQGNIVFANGFYFKYVSMVLNTSCCNCAEVRAPMLASMLSDSSTTLPRSSVGERCLLLPMMNRSFINTQLDDKVLLQTNNNFINFNTGLRNIVRANQSNGNVLSFTRRQNLTLKTTVAISNGRGSSDSTGNIAGLNIPKEYSTLTLNSFFQNYTLKFEKRSLI